VTTGVRCFVETLQNMKNIPFLRLLSRRLTGIVLLLVLTHTAVRAQMLATRTNLLWDALGVFNGGVEIGVTNNSTVGIQVGYGRRPLYTQPSRVVCLQPEWRYYLSHRPIHGVYMGVGAVAADYDIKWKGKVYNGDAVGGGFVLGCVVTLSRRLNLDLHTGIGIVGYWRKEYYEGDNYNDYTQDGSVKTNASGYSLLPTNFGVTLSYILK